MMLSTHLRSLIKSVSLERWRGRHRRLRREIAQRRSNSIELLEERAMLAVLTVHNALDGPLPNLAGDGELSVREAIELANHPGLTIDGFSSNDDNDTIEFAPSLAGSTINLIGTQLSIISSVSVNGLGADRLSISGGGNTRVFYFGGSGTQAVNDLTIADGYTHDDLLFGGGVYMLGSGNVLNLNGVVLDGNRSESNGSGAAIMAQGGMLNISNSAIINTGAGFETIRFGSLGGSIKNTTISNNANGLALILEGVNANGLDLVNTTFANNAGGVLAVNAGQPPLTYQNSIFTGSGGVAGNVISLGNNILDDASGAPQPHATDRRSTDPLIFPLIEDSGTFVHPLCSNSPAIDAANTAAAPTLDQRGAGRFDGDTDTFIVADIGAFEYSGVPRIPPVNLSLDTNYGTEAASTVVTLTATAMCAVSGDQTVNVNISGAGIDTTDYTLSHTTITIPNGQTTGHATFTIENDLLVEPATETATLTLQNASAGITLGPDRTANIVIGNDDFDTEVALNGGTLSITDIHGAASNDNLTLSHIGSVYTLTDHGGLRITTSIPGATGNGTSSVTIPDSSVNRIVFDTLGGNDLIEVNSLQSNLMGGFAVNDGDGIDRFILNGDINTGVGDVQVDVTRNIVLSAGSSVTTTSGNILLNANPAGQTSGNFTGIAIGGTIETTSGTVSLTGQGGDTGASNIGVDLQHGGSITSTAISDAGSITIDGTGNATGTGTTGTGVLVNGPVQVNSGDLTIKALAEDASALVIGSSLASIGSGGIEITAESGETDLYLSAASNIGGPFASGPITFHIDDVLIDPSSTIQSAGALTIAPRTSGTSIGLGGGAGRLNLDDGELSTLVDGFSSITIGDTTVGTGTVDVDTVAFTDPITIAGGTIKDAANTDIDADANTVTLDGNVTPGDWLGTLTVNGNAALTADSRLTLDIDGKIPGSQHDQLQILGTSRTVTLGNAELSLALTGGFSLKAGDQFVIVDNVDPGSRVSGQFAGIAEGATVELDGVLFYVTYAGGDDNNDVVLTVVAPQFSITREDSTPTNADSVTFRVAFTQGVNFAPGDMVVATTGSVSSNTEVIIDNAGDLDDSTFRVTVEDIRGDGTLALDWASGSRIINDLGVAIDPNPIANEVYTIDNDAPNATDSAGRSQPFSTVQPFIALNYVISTEGAYASSMGSGTSEPLLGEIRIFNGNFAPRGWALADGQLLPISQNLALFSILGTIYGGDGRVTFGLPDLRGRVPVGTGAGPGLSPQRLGQKLGSEVVTLNGESQLASHIHTVSGSGVATGESGGGQSHSNMQPTLGMNYLVRVDQSDAGAVGEMAMFAGNFAPAGWARADGQLLTISNYPALFSVLGTTYGGDGLVSFALPDLRGRVAIGSGAGAGLTARAAGSIVGTSVNTLTGLQLAAHDHTLPDTNLTGLGQSVSNLQPSLAIGFAIDANAATVVLSADPAVTTSSSIQGRAIMHTGVGAGLTPRNFGEVGGSEIYTLLADHLPSHYHTLGSITRQPLTNDNSLVFRVTFTEDVMNVGIDDFVVDGTSTGMVTGVLEISPDVYDVTVSGGNLETFAGQIGLNFATTQDIKDLAGNAYPGGEPPIDETYVLSATDLSISQTDNQTTAIPGEAVTYTIVVTNNGPRDVTGAMVTDTFPSILSDATYTSVATGDVRGSTASGSGNISDTVDMGVGATITYTVIARVDSDATGSLVNTAMVSNVGDIDDRNDSATDTTALTPEASLSITKDDGVTTAVPGDDFIVYTIVVSNAGPSDDPAVSLTDALPDELLSETFSSVATGGATGNTAAGSGDLAETLSMPAGSSVTYTVTASIDPAASGTLSNTVSAVGSVTERNPGDETASDNNTLLVPEADIAVTIDDGATSVVPGQDTVTYTIVVSNNGPSDDPSVSLIDTLPAELLSASFTSVATGGGAGNTAAGSGNLAETLNMPAGSSVTYTVTASIDPAASGTLSNTVSAVGSVTERNPGDETASDNNTLLVPEADIAVTIDDGVASAVPGQDTVTYTIVVSNIGPSDDPSVSLIDTLPAELVSVAYTSVAAGGATGNTATGSGDLVETLNMPADSSVTYTVTASIDPAASGTLSNTVSAVGSVTESNPGDEMATDNNTVLVPEADISVTIDDGVTSAVPGQDTVTYTIVVSNIGPSDDPSVSLIDTLPAELVSVAYTSMPAGGATGNTAAGSGDLAETLSMPAGSSVTYTVTASIDPAATGILLNTVSAVGSVTERNPGDEMATDNNTVLVPEADISVTIDDGVTSAVPGQDTIVYTIVVSNNGPSDDPAVSVTDTLPDELVNLQLVSVNPTGNASTTLSAGTLSGSLADTAGLPAGQSVTYVVSGDIVASATGTVISTVSITGSVTESNSGDETATDNNTLLVPEADISVTIDDGVTIAVPGQDTITYTIVVSNNGPSDDPSVSLIDTLPVELFAVAYTSVAAGGATGNTAAGSGDLVETLNMPADSSVTYTVTASIDAAATGTLSNTATVTASVTERVSINDSATDDDTVLAPIANLSIIMSDAPDPVLPGGTLTYLIAVTNSGPSTARNNIVTATLDAAVTPSPEVSILISDLGPGESQEFDLQTTVRTNAVGIITTSAVVTSATFDPDSSNDTTSEETQAGTLDFGDAPTGGPIQSPPDSYPTLLAHDGARHIIIPGSPVLGSAIDKEDDGQPDAMARGDDTDSSGDDEDGVTFDTDWVAGFDADITVTASAAGFLDAFVDFNADGDWDDPGEQIFASVPLVGGANALTFAIPADAAIAETFARFRISTAGGLSYDGLALDGEVEDYAVEVESQLAFRELLDERIWLDVVNVSPDGIIVYAWGTQAGSTFLPQYGVTLGIANATLASLSEGDVDGTSSGVVPIPLTPAGQQYLFQAFEIAPNPQVTNVLPLSIAGSPVVVMTNNAAPEAVAELPNFSATVGKSFDFKIADETFIDPDSDASLFYNARQSDGSPLPDWLTFDSSGVSFHSDRVPTSGQWTITVTATDNGTPVRFTSTTFILNAVANRSVWQNEANRYDVNQDGEVTPLDALIVLNRMRFNADSELPAQRIDGESLLDVNGDLDLSPIDALQVLNFLNAKQMVDAESTSLYPVQVPKPADRDRQHDEALATIVDDFSNPLSTNLVDRSSNFPIRDHSSVGASLTSSAEASDDPPAQSAAIDEAFLTLLD